MSVIKLDKEVKFHQESTPSKDSVEQQPLLPHSQERSDIERGEATKRTILQRIGSAGAGAFHGLSEGSSAAAEYASAKVDLVSESALGHVLHATGKYFRESIHVPYMPRWMRRCMDRMHLEVWGGIERELRRSVMTSIGISRQHKDLRRRRKDFREMHIKHWAGPPSIFTRHQEMGKYHCNFLCWLRAKILYSEMPADGNFFRNLTNPFALVLLLLKLHPHYGSNVLVFMLLFYLADKTDEYQLVEFIIKFKVSHRST